MRKLLNLAMSLALVLVVTGCSKAAASGDAGTNNSKPSHGPANHDDHKATQQGPR